MLNKILNYWISRNLEEIEQGTFKLVLPDTEETILLHGKSNLNLEATLEVKSWKALWLIYSRGSLGFTEGYLENYWDTDDLMKLMDLISKNYNSFDRVNSGSGFWKLLTKFSHFRNENSLSGSKKNIHAHYDLGNDFYESWLDETMTYSSGFFERNSDSLKEAQNRKYKLILDTLGLPKNSSILEIGCGWGGFSEFLARNYDCDITAITISQEQFNYAKKRIKKARLDKKININYCDYRNIQGKFDKILSIEMFEAVGKNYWETFFKKLKSILSPNGIIGLQLITIDDKIYDTYRKNPDFIQKYIFPGGMLPSEKILKSLISKHSLILENDASYANDYAKTLNVWKKNFDDNWDKIQKLGFDNKFRLMWNYYLSYCEGGFLSKNIDLKQIKLRINYH